MKHFFIYALLAWIPFQAFTQISIGARAGLHSAWQTVQNTDYVPKTILGPTAGLMVEIPFSSNLSLQPELVYVRKGFKRTSVTTLGDEFELEFHLDHLEVPLLLKYKTDLKLFNIYLLAGPTIGRAVDGHVIAFGSVEERFGPREWRYYRRTELSGSLGGGIQLGKEKVRFLVDCRYLFGLHDLVTEGDEKSMNRGISIGGGLLLRI